MYAIDVNKQRKHTKLKLVDNVAVVTFDSPDAKLNSLSREVMEEFEEIVNGIETDPGVASAVLISGKKDNFIAGADINMLASCKTKDEVKTLSKECHRLLAKVEQSPKPYVAAIQGTCLGGGLEVTLACHYRLAMKGNIIFLKEMFNQEEFNECFVLF